MERNSWARTVHDFGLTIWTGAMGAVGLNAVAKPAVNPTNRIRVATPAGPALDTGQRPRVAAYAAGGATVPAE